MVCIRRGSPVLALVGALVFVGACKKDDKKADPATGQTAGDSSAKPASGTASMAAGAVDLALLPLDSELVVGINLSQILQSALWKQFVEPKIMTPENTKKLADFKTQCGFDPTTAVKTMSIGLKGLANDKPDGVVVIHGVDKAKLWSCLDTMKAEMAKDGTEYTKDGDVAMFKNTKGGPPVALTFTNDTTAVGVIGDQATPAGVKAVTAGNSALKSSPPFLDMYTKVKTTDSLWLLMNGNAKVLDKMSTMGIKAKAVFGSLNVTDGLSLDMRLRLESPDAATQLTTMSKQQMAQAAKMFDQIDVAADGSDVKYTVVLSNQKLQQLIAQFGPMLGAFGGMGGGMGGNRP
jgi:hypothetical protein